MFWAFLPFSMLEMILFLCGVALAFWVHMLKTDPEDSFCLLKTNIAFHPWYVLWLVVHVEATQIKIDTNSKTKWWAYFCI